MKAAWYERQGAAGDVLVLGEMEDAQPRAGEVRIRVAFSGVNPGDIKKREDSFHVGCRIHGSFRTAIVRASLMRLAKECRGNGSADACGAMALNRTALSEPPPSTPWFARSRWFKSSITCRWNKGPVSASRHNRPSGSSCHRSNRGTNRSRPGWGWCGGRLCRSSRPSSGSASDRDLPLGERQGDSIASRSGKEMMSNARRSRSTLQPATWRPPGGISVQTPLWPAAVAVSFKKIAAG